MVKPATVVGWHRKGFNELQLRRVMKSYIAYFHEDRTHLTLQKETPFERPVDDGEGDVVAFPRGGGLHHRYARPERKAA